MFVIVCKEVYVLLDKFKNRQQKFSNWKKKTENNTNP